MLNLFGKKNDKNRLSQLSDLDSNPLNEGELVDCLRYEMGISRLLLVNNEWIYESVETGKQVSYIRMIDAITGNQKVKKIKDQQRSASSSDH